MCLKNSRKLHLFVALLLLVSLSVSFAQVSTPEPMYVISESKLLRLLWIETRSGEINAELQKAHDLSIEQLKNFQEESTELRKELSELRVRSEGLEKSSSEAVEASLKAESSLRKLEESFDTYMKTAELRIKKLGKTVFLQKVFLFILGAVATGIAVHDITN